MLFDLPSRISERFVFFLSGPVDAAHRGRPDDPVCARAAARPVAAPAGHAQERRPRVDPQLSVQGQKD